jgi:hypothetical protein
MNTADGTATLLPLGVLQLRAAIGSATGTRSAEFNAGLMQPGSPFAIPASGLFVARLP